MAGSYIYMGSIDKKIQRHIQKNQFKSKTTVPRAEDEAGLLLLFALSPSSTVNSTELTSSHRVWVIPQVSLGRNRCGNFPASASGEWQVTASVTNESSVQLHLFNALLWRANHSSLFVKLPPPLRKGERERKLNIYRNQPSWEYCYKPLTLNIFHSSAEWQGLGDFMTKHFYLTDPKRWQ